MSKNQKVTPATPWGYRRLKTEYGRVAFQAVHPDVLKSHAKMKQRLAEVKQAKHLDCVRAHLRNRMMLKIDIARAFASVDPSIMQIILDYELVETEGHFFHKPCGLIEGAPNSPALFELYCQNTIDPKLARFCEQNGFTWTRYVDDVVISCDTEFGRRSRRSLRKIVGSWGFSINESKYFMRNTSRHRLKVMGVDFYRGRVSVPVEFYEKVVLAERRLARLETQLGLERNLGEFQLKALKHARNVVTGLRGWECTVLSLNSA